MYKIYLVTWGSAYANKMIFFMKKSTFTSNILINIKVFVRSLIIYIVSNL